MEWIGARKFQVPRAIIETLAAIERFLNCKLISTTYVNGCLVGRDGDVLEGFAPSSLSWGGMYTGLMRRVSFLGLGVMHGFSAFFAFTSCC